jgi:hypothetical protein
MQQQRYDQQNVSKLVATKQTALGILAVPAKLTRWVTFLHGDNRYGGINTLYICSVPASTTLSAATIASRVAKASMYAKKRIQMPNEGSYCLPANGPAKPCWPLFSIAASSYMSFICSKGSASVNLQYFDESRTGSP